MYTLVLYFNHAPFSCCIFHKSVHPFHLGAVFMTSPKKLSDSYSPLPLVNFFNIFVTPHLPPLVDLTVFSDSS